jgi:hypothetical protein
MKKNVVLAFLCIFLLVGLVSCREANEFEETTLTVVNDTEYTIDMIEIQTYVGYSDRVAAYNALPEGMTLDAGGTLLFALPPVQAEGSSTSIRVSNDVIFEYETFTYDEGAEVTLTFNPATSAEGSPYFTIEGGTFVK